MWHHTATPASVTPPQVLWNGRPGLPGPLCNTSGNADGSITVIAAHPANHAGASGGRAMGPLPVTRAFNKFVWGHEIVYPGNTPMSDAQYRSAIELGAVISQLLHRPNAEWCRGHLESSITGKWDPGCGPGRSYDMARMRADVLALMRGADASAASTPTSKKVKPVMIERELTHGKNYLRVPAMVGSTSALFKRAFVSITGELGGTMQVAFQKNAPNDGPPPGTGPIWGPTVFRNASRVWREIPDGTEFLDIDIDLKGRNGSVAIEFEPR
nr:N-acetylmuramoyl-L-alanine amidase [Pseudonocardia sp. ICBG601]